MSLGDDCFDPLDTLERDLKPWTVGFFGTLQSIIPAQQLFCFGWPMQEEGNVQYANPKESRKKQTDPQHPWPWPCALYSWHPVAAASFVMTCQTLCKCLGLQLGGSKANEKSKGFVAMMGHLRVIWICLMICDVSGDYLLSVNKIRWWTIQWQQAPTKRHRYVPPQIHKGNFPYTDTMYDHFLVQLRKCETRWERYQAQNNLKQHFCTYSTCIVLKHYILYLFHFSSQALRWYNN